MVGGFVGVLVLVLAALALVESSTPASVPSRIDVFTSHTFGYACFKIPTLFQTLNGTLLAFSEARGGQCSDWDATDVVLRRSTDGGSTWGPVVVVVPGAFEFHTVAGNLGVVQDAATGRVFLPFTRGNYVPYVSHSDDNGESWAEPRELPGLKPQAWTWLGFGPPAGLQLSAASPTPHRLVIPGYFSTSPFYDNGVLLSNGFAMVSDDHGETWSRSGPIPNGWLGLLRGIVANECQMVETSGGEVLVNSRTLFGNRLQARSSDGGTTWSKMERTTIPSPVIGCEGSIVADSGNRSRLVFSGPDNKANMMRVRMSVWESGDAGRSWSGPALVDDSPSVGYSSMVHLHNGTIALLYGRSNRSAKIFVPEHISLVMVRGMPSPPTPLPVPEVPQHHDMSWRNATGSKDFTKTTRFRLILGVVTTQYLCVLGLVVCTLWEFPGDWDRGSWAWRLGALACVVVGLALWVLATIGTVTMWMFRLDDASRWQAQACTTSVFLLVWWLVRAIYRLWRRRRAHRNRNVGSSGGRVVDAVEVVPDKFAP